MIWKLLTVAEKNWRKLNSPELLPLVASGVKFRNGIAVRTKKADAEESQPERIAA